MFNKEGCAHSLVYQIQTKSVSCIPPCLINQYSDVGGGQLETKSPQSAKSYLDYSIECSWLTSSVFEV